MNATPRDATSDSIANALENHQGSEARLAEILEATEARHKAAEQRLTDMLADRALGSGASEDEITEAARAVERERTALAGLRAQQRRASQVADVLKERRAQASETELRAEQNRLALHWTERSAELRRHAEGLAKAARELLEMQERDAAIASELAQLLNPGVWAGPRHYRRLWTKIDRVLDEMELERVLHIAAGYELREPPEGM